MTGVKADVAGLKTDMTDMKTAVAGLQTDMTAVRVSRSLDLTPTVATMRKEIDALAAEVAELRRRAS